MAPDVGGSSLLAVLSMLFILFEPCPLEACCRSHSSIIGWLQLEKSGRQGSLCQCRLDYLKNHSLNFAWLRMRHELASLQPGNLISANLSNSLICECQWIFNLAKGSECGSAARQVNTLKVLHRECNLLSKRPSTSINIPQVGVGQSLILHSHG